MFGLELWHIGLIVLGILLLLIYFVKKGIIQFEVSTNEDMVYKLRLNPLATQYYQELADEREISLKELMDTIVTLGRLVVALDENGDGGIFYIEDGQIIKVSNIWNINTDRWLGPFEDFLDNLEQ